MRFYEHSPNIPEELISAQRRGEVVFFCGAGVSVPAKLPTFQGLARDVMRKFGVSTASNATLAAQLEQIEEVIESGGEKKLTFSLDQTFYLLQQEYGKSAIAEEVLAAIRVPKELRSDGHNDILRLSRNREGHPQIVTTNFDLLFEQADRTAKSHVPPALPSLGNGEQINGVVYLHGKYNESSVDKNTVNNLIISSADFGRAYLANGWANTFVKELARQYVIVLVGYTAEDPPVRYLLEGLHMQGNPAKPRIYSFERGKAEGVTQNWVHRGVTGIAYENHSDLWSSLKAWAEFAEAPQDWHLKTIQTAMQSPSFLKPYQRGQVAFSVGTVDGARLFSEASPPPTAQWLFVFDPYIRNRKPVHGRGEMFSSQEHFSLNDEVYPAKESTENAVIGKDYLAELPTDDHRQHRIRLPHSKTALPARLMYLAYWFTQVMDQPAALWWAIGEPGRPVLSGHLRNMVESKIRSVDPRTFSHFDAWSAYLEQDTDPTINEARLYAFKNVVLKQGWGMHTLRNFEKAIRPVYEVKRYWDSPPLSTEENSLVVGIKLPEMSGFNINIPDEHIADIVRIYRTCIERFVALSSATNRNLIPDFLDDQTLHLQTNLFKYIQWFKELYSRLAEISPERARTEVSAWILNDEKFFASLRIHAWSQPGLFEPSVVMAGIYKFDEKFVWHHLTNHIAKLVGSIWQRLSNKERADFLQFVRTGPSAQISFGPGRELEDEAAYSARLLAMLRDAKCKLDKDSQTILLRAKKHKHWIEPAEREPARGARIIPVVTEDDPGQLLTIPVNRISEKALEIEGGSNYPFETHKPFVGLVRIDTRRAYLALTPSRRKKNYPVGLWGALFESLPEATCSRLKLCLVEQALRMPKAIFDQLATQIGSFVEKVLPELFTCDHAKGAAIWDSFWGRLAGEKTQEVEDSEQPGIRGQLSYSPLGRHILLLLNLYSTNGIHRNKPLKAALLERLTLVLSTPGNARRYLINFGFSELAWFQRNFQTWTRDNLVPCLRDDDEDHEAAWNGFAFSQSPLPPSLFTFLRSEYKNVFRQFSRWPWGMHLHRTMHRDFLTYYKGKKGKGLSDVEARQILQKTDDDGRVNILYQLPEAGKWQTFQKPFFDNAWPRELKYRNPRISSALIKVAFDNKAIFPTAVETILPFMTYITHVGADFHPNNVSVTQLARRHPEAMLSLLDAAIQEETFSTGTQIELILNAVEKSEPSLTKTYAMRRLREFLDHHPY